MAAVRLLAYDVAGDVVDEYLRIGASTALKCLKIFCRAMYDIFSEQYLRQPTREDVARLIAENARRGFPGMLGSIDLRFEVNGNEYNMGYYLADGIYPSWVSFVKTIPRPLSQKYRTFARYQEDVRKDVERAFGVFQARWHVVRGPSRMWDPIDLDYIMKTCIILHDMIVEDEREDMFEDRDFPARDNEYVPPDIVTSRDPSVEFNIFLERRVGIRNIDLHNKLHIEHIWIFHEDE
ncbi:uncharacterized protein [Henckelia pumila]|uniref:uncharacterized protein n=1 Tax=Henckelia pumila TaxID=405737 RepID=UPI003C6E7A67